MDQDREQRQPVMRMLLQRLEELELAGVTHLARPRRDRTEDLAMVTTDLKASAPVRPESLPAISGAVRRVDAATVGSAGGLAGSPHAVQAVGEEERADLLDVIRREVAGCTRCQLCSTRTQTVFGVGNPHARLCFVGEAPGADEDRQGEPFVGRAGQLLDKIIGACTLERQQVYILNTLKCRPPENRTPLPDELAACRDFMLRQLEIIRPEFICCLGLVAARALLGSESSLARLRGRFHQFGDSRVLCTYHPAYLLRNPAAKKETWRDMQMLMQAMGIEPAKREGG